MRTRRDRTTDSVLRKAADLTARGRAARAVGLLRPIVIAEPGNATAWCELASAEVAAGHPKSAADALDRAEQDPSTAAGVARVRALLLLQAGDRDGAVRTAEHAVSADPGNWRAHSVLARVHAKVGDRDRAEAADAMARRLTGDHRRRAGESLLRRPLRRLSVTAALGAVFLLMAGMPAPAGILAWFGGALVVGLGVLAARTMPRIRFGGEPMPLRVALVAFVLAVGALSLWTVLLALGVHSLRLLGFAVGFAAVSVAVGYVERAVALRDALGRVR